MYIFILLGKYLGVELLGYVVLSLMLACNEHSPIEVVSFWYFPTFLKLITR
jgi:hypothetical protein